MGVRQGNILLNIESFRDQLGSWIDCSALIHVGVWSAFGATTLAIALTPGVPIAAWWPEVMTAISAIAATVGLSLFELGVLHFQALGRPLELLVGVGFGTLAVSNVLIGWLSATSELPLAEIQLVSLFVGVSHMLADLFLFAAVLQSSRIIPRPRRVRIAFRVTASALCLLAIGWLAVLEFGHMIPEGLSPSAAAALENGHTVSELLGDQAEWLILPRVLSAVLAVLVGYRLTVLARSTRDRYLAVLAPGMFLLALTEAHAALFPQGAPGYVSSADVIRLFAYLTLLVGLTHRTVATLVTSTSTDERLRLSRELHDGLAQQLSTLQLRLAQALGELGQDERLERHLLIGYDLARAALLEARHSITTLRGGTVTWDEFVEYLEAFCEEVGDNHDIMIVVETAGRVDRIDAALQLDVVRVLNEAISNAVRHGGARHIDVRVAIRSRPACLVLEIHDNGRGFVPGGQRIGVGVGLRSLSERITARGGKLRVDSEVAPGTTLRCELPLEASRVVATG
jgi:signal transduction histidine kinase